MNRYDVRNDWFWEWAAIAGGALIWQGLHDDMPPSYVIGGFMVAPVVIKYGVPLVCAIAEGCGYVPANRRKKNEHRGKRSELTKACTD